MFWGNLGIRENIFLHLTKDWLGNKQIYIGQREKISFIAGVYFYISNLFYYLGLSSESMISQSSGNYDCFWYWQHSCIKILLSEWVASGQTASREGAQLHLSADMIKDLSMDLPTEQDPVFPAASLSPQEACTSLLSSSIRKEKKQGSQSHRLQNENHNHRKPNWSHESQPCVTQWSYEPCLAGPPKLDRS